MAAADTRVPFAARPKRPNPGFGDGRVLVTGHSGFVGSWLCVMLTQMGANVSGISRGVGQISAGRIRMLESIGVKSFAVDVRDGNQVSHVVGAGRFTAIINLAAQSLVGMSYSHVYDTFSTNVTGTLNVVDAATRYNVPVVHVSSDKCYPPSRTLHETRTEKSPVWGTSPYANSKVAGEMVVSGYVDASNSDRNVAVSVRMGNVIGGGDRADRLVPNCIRAFRSGEPFNAFNHQSTRPFQHVLDAAFALARLTQVISSEGHNVTRPIIGRFGNPGLNLAPPGGSFKVGEVLDCLAEAWGDRPLGGRRSGDKRSFPEDEHLRVDGSVMHDLLEWKHKLDLRRSAKLIVDWEKSVVASDAGGAVTAGQIRDYLEDV